MNTFLFRNSGKLDISGLSNALNILKKKNPFQRGTNANDFIEQVFEDPDFQLLFSK